MLLEAGRHPGKESIIQMPGIRIGNEFFFDMVADSGINATYTPTMCEKDHAYADHLATRLSEYYDFSNGRLTVSQVHRHPDGCLGFSAGDYPANIKLARQFGGMVNGLIWIDPKFRIKFWYIDEDGKQSEAEYEINDKAVRDAMPRIDLCRLKETVEHSEAARGAFRKAEHKPEEKGASPETFMDFEKMQEALRPYKVLIPEEYRKQQYEGELRGYYFPETPIYNIVPEEFYSVRTDAKVLGTAVRSEHAKRSADGRSGQFGLSIVWNEGEAEISIRDNAGAEIHAEYYSCQQDVFSRNQGIVEKDRMSAKQAVITGAGSGGFKVGLELVRAGIGSLIVADNDILAYHNVCRHECGIHDVGRYKVDCFKERAADINPNCKVYTFRDLIQHVDPAALESIIRKDSVILCCADNRHCDYVCNELADKYHIPMVDAGCGPRASTGEVFYYRPDSGMACYTCAYGEDKGVDYSNQAVRRRFYATETELENRPESHNFYYNQQSSCGYDCL